LVAFEIEHALRGENAEWSQDPWELIDKAFEDPNLLPIGARQYIGDFTRKLWQTLPEERRALLILLSRLDIDADQATRIYEPAERQRHNIICSDEDLLENPYRIYELDRHAAAPISVETVDRGVFPSDVVRERFPVPKPSRVVEALDPRRAKAFVISTLEVASSTEGHTLLPASEIIRRVRDRPLSPQCPLTSDALSLIDRDLGSELVQTKIDKDGSAYQLKRLNKTGTLIKDEVLRRIGGSRHRATYDWRSVVDECLKKTASKLDEDELMARAEKAAALEEIFSSRFSVLVGPAGTGKTTLLR